MTTYPEYKATGLPWLPQIPKEWTAIKIKYAFAERSEKGYPQEPMLAATQNHGVIPKSLYENRTVTAQKDLHLLKLVRVGDFVISLRSFQGGIEYAYYQGIISPAYTIMFLKAEQVTPFFFRYLAKSKPFIKLLQTCVTGIREGQNIDYDSLKKNSIPVPSPAEQAQIVRYLDAMTAKINRLIRAKKKEIALLQEQKQDIISLMMRNDIEDNDNSVIPDGWKRMRMKYTSNQPLKYGANAVGIPFDERAIRYVRITDIDSLGKLKHCDRQSLPQELGKEYLLKDGDILFARCGGTVGKTYLYRQSDGACCYAGYLIKYRPNTQIILPEYIYLYTQSSAYNKWLKKVFIQATIQNISAEKYKNFELIIPPLDEQRRILAVLDSKLQKNFKAMQNKQKQIEYWIEYKNSLISSVVTGQVDVRNIVVEDVSPDDLILEDDDAVADSEEEEPVNESEE